MGYRVKISGLKQILKIKKIAQRAATSAGKRAIQTMRTAAVHEVRLKKAMRASQLNKTAIKVFTMSKTEWALGISGKAQPVSAYAVRQTKKGVSAKINTGKTSLIRHAFLLTVGGHKGVFFRKTKARFPLDQALTTRVSDVFRDSDEPALRVQEVGRAAFVTRWEHEFDRLSRGKPSQ